MNSISHQSVGMYNGSCILYVGVARTHHGTGWCQSVFGWWLNTNRGSSIFEVFLNFTHYFLLQLLPVGSSEFSIDAYCLSCASIATMSVTVCDCRSRRRSQQYFGNHEQNTLANLKVHWWSIYWHICHELVNLYQLLTAYPFEGCPDWDRGHHAKVLEAKIVTLRNS